MVDIQNSVLMVSITQGGVTSQLSSTIALHEWNFLLLELLFEPQYVTSDY